MKCSVFPQALDCTEVGHVTTELSGTYFACVKLDFSSEGREKIEFVSMTFYIDDFESQPYVLNIESSTSLSGVVYQISQDVFTDYLPFRTAHPGMSTNVLLKQHILTRLPYPYGDCMETAGYNRGITDFS